MGLKVLGFVFNSLLFVCVCQPEKYHVRLNGYLKGSFVIEVCGIGLRNGGHVASSLGLIVTWTFVSVYSLATVVWKIGCGSETDPPNSL